MSRTAHAVPSNHRDGLCSNHDCDLARWGFRSPKGRGYTTDPAAPWAHHTCVFSGATHTVRDLRFSALAEARAVRLGHRTTPELVVATLPRHVRYGRSYNVSRIGSISRAQERIARRDTREHLDAQRRSVNTRNRVLADDASFDGYDDGDFDVPPTRHLHRGVWQATW